MPVDVDSTQGSITRLLRYSLARAYPNTNLICVSVFACNNNSYNNWKTLENRARRKVSEKGRSGLFYRRVTSIQKHIQAATVAKWQPKVYVFLFTFLHRICFILFKYYCCLIMFAAISLKISSRLLLYCGKVFRTNIYDFLFNISFNSTQLVYVCVFDEISCAFFSIARPLFRPQW